MPSNFAITSNAFLQTANNKSKAVLTIQIKEYSSRNFPLTINLKIKNIKINARKIAII
jgi:hypothetical protein